MASTRQPGGVTTAPHACPRCGISTYGTPLTDLCALCEAHQQDAPTSTIGLWVAYAALAAPIGAILFVAAVAVFTFVLGL